MDIDSAVNIVNKELSQVEDIDDSCRVDFTEICSFTMDADGSCTTECINVDGYADKNQEYFVVVRQEPDDVCWIYFCCTTYIEKYMKYMRYMLYNYNIVLVRQC